MHGQDKRADYSSRSEIYTIVGRRGGKSFISSLTAVYIACFSSFKHYLNTGERAAILVLARDRDQAKIVFNYVSGILHAVAALNAMIAVERADEIELDNDVIIMVKTSDFRAIRGLTVAAAILDEVAFWNAEGVSPDHEVLTALRPAMATIPGAKLIAIRHPTVKPARSTRRIKSSTVSTMTTCLSGKPTPAP